MAIRDGRIYDVIQILSSCKENSDGEKRNFLGKSVLHLAVNFDQITLVKYFIRIGKNINDLNYFRQKPLHRACIIAQVTKKQKF